MIEQIEIKDSGNLILKILSDFLPASFRSGFEKSNIEMIELRFRSPEKKSIAPGTIANILKHHHIDKKNPVYDPKMDYYIVTQGLYCSSMDMNTHGAKSLAKDLGGMIAKEPVGKGEVSWKSSKDNSQDITMTYSGEKKLVYAIELWQVSKSTPVKLTPSRGPLHPVFAPIFTGVTGMR